MIEEAVHIVGYMGLSVLSSSFCCEPKTALDKKKIKSFKKSKEEEFVTHENDVKFKGQCP